MTEHLSIWPGVGTVFVTVGFILYGYGLHDKDHPGFVIGPVMVGFGMLLFHA